MNVSPVISTAPPWSVQAEKSLLCMALLAPGNIVPDLRRQQAGEAFFDEGHRAVWRQIVACFEQGLIDDGAISLIPLAEKLRATGEIEKIGGESALTKLASWEPGAEGWEKRWDIVKGYWLRRRAAAIGRALDLATSDLSQDADESIATAEAALFELREQRADLNRPRHASEFVDEAIEHIQMLTANQGMITGLPTGLTDLDRTLNGLQAKKFYVLAARPGVGKTVLEQVMCENISEGKGHYAEMSRMRERGIACRAPVLLVSLEVDGCQLMLRRILANTHTGLTLLRTGFFPRGFIQNKAVPAGTAIAHSGLWVWDAHDVTVEDLRGEVRRWMREVVAKHQFPANRPKHLPRALVCVDHIGLLKGSAANQRLGRTAEVTEISSKMLHMAKEFEIPVLALSQLNRETEKKGSGRPTLANLRDSGAIEQDGDVVMMLYRPKDYDRETDYTVRADPENRLNPQAAVWTPPGPSMPGWERKAELVKLSVLKHRGGPVGDIDLGWEAGITQFHSLTAQLYSNNAVNRQHTTE